MNGSNDMSGVLSAAMADLSANFATPTDLSSVLEAVTAHAVEFIDEVHLADVLLVDEDQYRSVAPTEDLATELDTLQLDIGEGPCLSAAGGEAMIVSSDLTAEPRWPRFAAAARQRGIYSIMSFQLYTFPAQVRGGTGGRGALNLFSRNPYQFTNEEQAVGAMLATQAATALIAANRQKQFESALASRDILGQAKGILMERFKIDAVRAFNLMAKYSQETNTKVRILAQHIVDSA